MARIPIDGNVKVTWFAACADITAPKVATEITATGFFDLQTVLTPDGLNVNVTEDTKDTTVLASTFNSDEPGRAGGTITLTYFRDTVTGNDKAYTTLKRFTAGFLAIRFGSAQGTAWAAADKCQVYPVQCFMQKDVPAAKNTDWQISQDLSITADWARDAVAAA